MADSALVDLVSTIVQALVEHPDQASVRERTEGNLVILEISVAEGDGGRVIGKGGQVINSIRALAQVLAAKRGQRVSLEVL